MASIDLVRSALADGVGMIRSEAKGVPHLMVAPKGSNAEAIHESSNSDLQGYYSYGAYTAAPSVEPAMFDERRNHVGEENPQAVYRKSLFLRYRLLRANLRVSPPAGSLAGVDQEHPISVTSKQYSKWLRLLRFTNPTPGQVASMNQRTVMKLIKFITTSLLKRGQNIKLGLGCWMWALLGRLEEVGCLNTEEVGVVRELGKRAIWMLASISQDIENGELLTDEAEGQENSEADEAAIYDSAEATTNEPVATEVAQDICELQAQAHTETPTSVKSEEDIPMGGQKISSSCSNSIPKEGGSDNGDETYIHESADTTDPQLLGTNEAAKIMDAKSQLLARVCTEEVQTEVFPSYDTRATLDMIISIVGELYGQTDLLEFREDWSKYS